MAGAVASALLAAAASAVGAAAQVMPPWPLAGTAEWVKEASAATPLQEATGLKRADYLDTISGVVQFWRHHQNASGHIIDPYRGEETQYATPCFAYACATVFTEGGDPTLLPNCSAALTAASEELATKTCADGHCVFFMKPMMFAYRLLAPRVSAAEKAIWDTNLQRMDPYRDFGFPSNNWGLVGTLDMLRTDLITHFGNSSWWKSMLDAQFGHPESTLTANGLYQDHTGMDGLNPLPYAAFPVLGYVTAILREGHQGPHRALMNEVVRRAAWTWALAQSPFGELPTGGRSSQHTWNEAVTTIVFEMTAVDLAAGGDAQGACMMKRAARLAHRSVRNWRNGEGPHRGSLQILKNRFDPSLRFGFEDYSFFSQYGLLPAAMLAAAFAYSDPSDAIPECAAPADLGGFAFELPEHRLVIANAGGVYVQVETGADPHYDSTGLHRIHINTCGVGIAGACAAPHSLLTPSAGPRQKDGGIAVGPWWSTSADGSRASLASTSYKDIEGVVFTPSWFQNRTAVSFEVGFFLRGGISVSQLYHLSVNPDGSSPKVSVTSSVRSEGTAEATPRALRGLTLSSQRGADQGGAGEMKEEVSKKEATEVGAGPGALRRFGVQFPAFLFDGMTNTTVQVLPEKGTATVSGPSGAGWGSITYAVEGQDVPLTWSYDAATQTPTRNGFMSTIWVEAAFKTQSPSLTQTVTAGSA